MKAAKRVTKYILYILCLIFIPPIGIFVVWKGDWPKRNKIITSGLSALWLVIFTYIVISAPLNTITSSIEEAIHGKVEKKREKQTEAVDDRAKNKPFDAADIKLTDKNNTDDTKEAEKARDEQSEATKIKHTIEDSPGDKKKIEEEIEKEKKARKKADIEAQKL